MLVVAAPQAIADLSDSCIRYVQRALGIELDYTQDTLPVLDHYIRTLPKEPGPIVDLVAPTCGAYFGEVIRRTLGGIRWHVDGTEHANYRLEFERCFLHFNPMGMALEAVTQREAEGWGAHFQILEEDTPAVTESLERTGQVREEDFFRLAVRFEVVEQVAGILLARAAFRGDGKLHFGPELYASATAYDNRQKN